MFVEHSPAAGLGAIDGGFLDVALGRGRRHRHPLLFQPLDARAGVDDYEAHSGDGLTPGSGEEGVVGFQNPHRSYEFARGIGEVVSALLSAGLRLDRLTEYPYSNGWRGFERMADIGGRRMVPPEDMPRLPLMYGLVASRPA